ncbi:hypothetical protein RYX36_005613, partial [Vicia faba]
MDDIQTARQMGFKDRRIGPDICRLASEYISKYEGFEDDIYSYFENEPDADSLYVKPFWAGASGNAVVIEADAFKESDVNP